jgi:hypothetical protein
MAAWLLCDRDRETPIRELVPEAVVDARDCKLGSDLV